MGRKWRRGTQSAVQLQEPGRWRAKQEEKKKNLHQTFKVSVTSIEKAFIACDSTLGFIFTPTAAVHVDVSIGTDMSA